LLVLCAVLAPSIAFGSSYAFLPLGHLSGQNPISYAFGISADGSTVVGASGNRPFRWTAAEGLVGLESPLTDSVSVAFAASANGSMIVGRAMNTAAVGSFLFQWSPPAGTVTLGPPSSEARAVSADGSIVAGWRFEGGSDVAARWEDGNELLLGKLSGGTGPSRAFGISANGQVIVGLSDSANSGNEVEAFRWTAAEGMVGLGDLPGGLFHSAAFGASQDGSVIVGYGRTGAGLEAFRWTDATGMQPLGVLAGLPESEAHAVSANGSVVVGESYSRNPINGWTPRAAFIWNSNEATMQDLRAYLIAKGVTNLNGWSLDSAYGVSADGLKIVGWGYNPAGQQEAWVAVIPEPSTYLMLALGAFFCFGHALRRK